MTTEMEPTATIPTWDLADRMRKSLRTADLGVAEIADYLGVSRNAVSTWINGRITPSKQTLRLWALRCGVPFEWLAGIPEGVRRPGSCPPPADANYTWNWGLAA